MARTPKPASTPLPARRGRMPKTAGTPAEPDVAGSGSAVTVETAGPDAVTDALTEQPGAGRRGQPSRRQAKTAISSVFESDPGKQPVADVDPLEAAAGPTPAEDDAQIAEMTDPVSANEAPPRDTSANAAGSDGSGASAAEWDRATDTVRFNWTEIERTASQDGPNQVMAKLLVAARAGGRQLTLAASSAGGTHRAVSVETAKFLSKTSAPRP